MINNFIFKLLNQRMHKTLTIKMGTSDVNDDSKVLKSKHKISFVNTLSPKGRKMSVQSSFKPRLPLVEEKDRPIWEDDEGELATEPIDNNR